MPVTLLFKQGLNVKCKYSFSKSTFCMYVLFILTLPVLCISESCIEIKIKLNSNFHTSLWCLKRFYEGL